MGGYQQIVRLINLIGKTILYSHGVAHEYSPVDCFLLYILLDQTYVDE